MKNKPQKIGVILLLSTGVLGLLGEFGAGWVAYGITGIITAACAIRDEIGQPTRTVSQYIQDWTTSKPKDYALGLAIIIFCAWQHFSMYGFEEGMRATYWSLPIGLAIHFFANKD